MFAKIIKKILYIFILFPLCALSDQFNINPNISYEQWQMPNALQPMSILGLHGDMHFNNWSYGGVGLYSAVAGQNGGFFALALEAGLQHALYSKLFWDAGIRAGGGGGHNTPVGDGLFVEPYAGLKYNFQYFNLELYYSYVNFIYGNIASNQLGVSLGLPLDSNYFNTDSDTKNYIAALSKIYFLNTNTLNNSNQVMNTNIELLGFEFAHFVSRQLFLFFNFSGAIHGNQNGYADELLGLGYQFPLFYSNFDAILKLAAGSGGGGDVNTGGGLIYSPLIGLEYHFSKAFAAELNGGYMDAPEGNFFAKQASVLLKYYFGNDNSIHSHETTWRIRILNQTYFDPRSESGAINPTMQLLNIDLDYFISHYFYFTGQSAFAYIGENTGGYFSGMLGLGALSPFISKTSLQLFAEILAGTAGGAGLSIGDGALFEPLLGIQYQVTPSIALQISTGYLMALSGEFRSETLQAGIAYHFKE